MARMELSSRELAIAAFACHFAPLGREGEFGEEEEPAFNRDDEGDFMALADRFEKEAAADVNWSLTRDDLERVATAVELQVVHLEEEGASEAAAEYRRMGETLRDLE